MLTSNVLPLKTDKFVFIRIICTLSLISVSVLCKPIRTSAEVKENANLQTSLYRS